MAYRAAVFDLDGTLLDSYAAIHDCLNAVLVAFERPPVSVEKTRRMVGHGLEALVRTAVGEGNVAEGVRLFRERYAVVGPGATTLLPGAADVTRRLLEGGVPLAVASNKPSVFSVQLLAELGLGDRFVAVVGPEDGVPPKPDPEMVRRLFPLLGFGPAETLFVGDMAVDVETARAAGMPVAVVPTGSATRDELLEAGADHLLGSLSDVLALFAI
jgi:2-phosphoglycolate phosphatase